MDREIIRVLSRRAPTLSWHCSKCHDISIFQSTELFRANANGKLIDIWLTYRCRRCDHTRNFTVVERTAVKRLPPGLLDAAEGNDPAIARGFARDLGLIHRNGARVAEGDQFELMGPERPLLGQVMPLEVSLEFPEPLLLHLDAVMARSLAVSKGALGHFLESGTLVVAGTGKTNTLRLWAGAVLRVGGSMPI